MKKIVICLCSFVALTLPAIAQRGAQESPHETAAAEKPVATSSLFENEQVQILRIHLDPHEKTPMHDVTPRVVVWLSSAHFLDTYADGTKREEFRKVGDAEFLSARRHAGENLSDQPMDFIGVVLKGGTGHQ